MAVVVWQGRSYYRPTADSVTDITGMTTVGLTAAGIIMMLGTATGGTPFGVQKFNDSVSARRYFKSGALIDAMDAAWAEGARTIYATRIGNTTGIDAVAQATGSLLNGATSVVVLTSQDYGSWTNDIRYKVEDGSGVTPVGKKVTIQWYDTSTGTVSTETWDNLLDGTAIVDAINNGVGKIAGSSLVEASVGTNPSLVPDNIGFTSLAGGADGLSPVLANWQAALDLYNEETVDVLHPAGTSDETVHALFKAHCVERSNKRYERICILGGALGEAAGNISTPDTAVYRAYNLNTARAVLVAPGTDDEAPYFTAAKIAGAVASADVATSLTRRTINATSIETKYSDTNKDDLVTYGVLTIEEVPQGRRVIRGITTIQDTSLTQESPYKEITTVRIADYVNNVMRTNLEGIYIGKKGVSGVEASIASDATSLLLKLKEAQIILGFQNVVVNRDTSDPKIIYVSYSIAPIQPINFIFITTKLVNIL